MKVRGHNIEFQTRNDDGETVPFNGSLNVGPDSERLELYVYVGYQEFFFLAYENQLGNPTFRAELANEYRDAWHSMEVHGEWWTIGTFEKFVESYLSSILSWKKGTLRWYVREAKYAVRSAYNRMHFKIRLLVDADLRKRIYG